MYNTLRPAPHRVDRHRGRLGAYDMKVDYVPGDKHPCDYGSRHPTKLPENLTKEQREEMGIESEEEDTEIWVGKITKEVLPAITMRQLKDDTRNDPELQPLLREKRKGQMSKETSKGPYGKMWNEIRERDGRLLKEDKIIVPRILQPQAIALAQEGHMQAYGTLRQLRETLWFRGMRREVQQFVDTCKCAAANPRNPKPPLKLRPQPTEPWKIVAVDYKGPVGPQRWYLHTTMDVYSRYPEVHMTKSTGMGELRKVMDRTMRTHGCPDEIWSDGGPPYNGYEWEDYVKDWGGTPRKTTPYHPPANGMVERFNQVLKQTILAAYAEKKDPIEEVDKVVAAYRNTPHSVTKVKPSLLMFNRDITTKLPRFTTASRGRHHREARSNDKRAKIKMKRNYDKKHRTKTVTIKVGDKAYIRNTATSSTKGQWDPNPYKNQNYRRETRRREDEGQE